MADNYLEKRMEEYRSGKLAPKSGRTGLAVSRKPGEFVMTFAPMSVMVLGEDAALVSAVCSTFRKADFHVAFCMADQREGTRIAQNCGCRFYPYPSSDAEKVGQAIDDLDVRWGRLDVVLDLRGLKADDFGENLSPVASLMLLHSHPAFNFLTSAGINL